MNFGYVFPWDIVGDPAAPERLAATGVDAIALAVSYHSTRAATPFHPAHRVLEVSHSAFYLPVRRSAFGALVPRNLSWTAPDAFIQARDALRAAGLPVHAWTVLTHNSLLGDAHPGLTVRNAFGDMYPHALCPAHEDVVEYCARLVAEVAELGEPDGIILEACGPMGVTHQSVHDKTPAADWDPTQAALLSLCFCTACVRKYPDTLRARVRAAVDAPAPDSSLEGVLGELAGPVREARLNLTATLLHSVTAATNLSIRLHASADPWATGSFSPLTDSTSGRGLGGVVALCWGSDEEATANVAQLVEPGRRLGAYTTILPPKAVCPESLGRTFRALGEAGADELHVYHLGLASPGRLAALAGALKG
ncbi:hypothetical protein Aph01nite_48450 [Acrocarpospora phusangensis]|uniref:Alanine-rich protein n=1 Tax=Acrocarpospora phusangensis TaxID=1070424 RepID=A0A919QFP1_9ACTN|nr:hypothetical protein [Acrocarpospora phusangensis]GIH26535.1 hypothetical protein Aph01nite_48450 [Acrocarpospora phusangensis]